VIKIYYVLFKILYLGQENVTLGIIFYDVSIIEMEPIMVMLSTLSSARVENKLLEFFVNA
jgi:hypothetical protein